MYRHIYITDAGYVRLPFAHLPDFLRLNRVTLQQEEIRGVVNMHQFVNTALILSDRIKTNLTRFLSKNHTQVNFDELFLDAQSFILFIQQFFEDVNLVVRSTYQSPMRDGWRSSFVSLLDKLPPLLSDDHPLKLFLQQESRVFEEVKDIRDDILHRTPFNRARTARFPDFLEFVRSAIGSVPFVSGQDLKSYLSHCFDKVMALACLCDDLVRDNLLVLYPGNGTPEQRFPLSAIIPMGAVDFTIVSVAPQYPPGTIFATFSPEAYESLLYLLPPDNGITPVP